MNFVYAKATLASALKQRNLALWCCVGLTVTNMGLAFKLMGTEEHWVLMPQYQDEHRLEKLKHVCARIKPGYLTTVQTKALEQGLGLQEICRGDPAALWEVPVTPELDVEGLKKKFFPDYCRNRQWHLIETQDQKPPQNIFVGERRYVVHPYTRKMRLSQKSLENTQGRRLRAELDCCIDRLRKTTRVGKTCRYPGYSTEGGVLI